MPESKSGGVPSIAALRAQLATLDDEILHLIAQRQAIAADVARAKEAARRPTRDFAQEREVIDRARRTAAQLNLGGDLAERLMLLLIGASLTAQEQYHVQSSGAGAGQRVLIIGGAGKMGRWLARFLGSQGFAIEIADPSGPVPGFAHIDDWHSSPLDHDMIVVAAPLRISETILSELATRKPAGIVFDIGSLKTPLRSGLLALANAGVPVTSIHPMFGPDTELLSGRHIIYVDLGFPDATRRVRQLFAPTMATPVELDLDSHDRLVAYILGLSHALNIAFFTALVDSGEAAQRLARSSSTTFDAQLDLARKVSAESPHLYYEIQALNEYGAEALNALHEAVERVRSAVQERDEETFVGLMRRGHRYLEGVTRP